MKTILVVDDEPQIAEIAGDYLRHAGFDVITAGDGARALEAARERRADLIVLDLALPIVDGIDVARAVRRESEIPIIMLTARAQEEDRLRGLEIGADDYITKPFSPRELVARVRAVLRRSEKHQTDDEIFRAADLMIDSPRMKIVRDGTAIDLTPTEFQIVNAMARAPGRIFTRQQLLDIVRGSGAEAFDRAIDTHTSRTFAASSNAICGSCGWNMPSNPITPLRCSTWRRSALRLSGHSARAKHSSSSTVRTMHGVCSTQPTRRRRSACRVCWRWSSASPPEPGC